MPKIVLVVEDCEDVREFMKFLIESYGYQVIEAGDGIEAVEMTKNHRPDLILMDIMMPRMDGITAAQIIRASNDPPDTPIIAITACANSYCRQALDAGCNQVLAKPLEIETLEPYFQQYLH